MEYDQFEAEMLEAGWSLEEIEAMWQKHSVNPSPFFHPDYIAASASSVGAKETLAEDN